MKASTIASVLLGLLSGTAVDATAAQLVVPSPDDKVKFKLTKFTDGRTTPYRLYFWDHHLTGSSYRFDQHGDLVYFKAGSEVYHNRKEVDGSITFDMKPETKNHDRVKPDYGAKMPDDFELPDCDECVDDLNLLVPGLPSFCENVESSSLGSDGQASVTILCTYRDFLVSTLTGICEALCATEQGPFCENGFVGVQGSSGVCCAAGCGECGGVGCGSRGRALGLDGDDCCITEITTDGEFCSVKRMAPCLIDDETTTVTIDEETLNLECQRSSMTVADQMQLDVYDTDMYLDAACVSDTIPNGCNYFGLGQECRGCFMTCDGASTYIEDNAQEIAEKGEEAIINFCPHSEVSDLESCSGN